MTTKERYIELVKLRILGIVKEEDSPKYDLRIIEMHLANAWNAALQKSFEKYKTILDSFSKLYHGVPIQWDADKEICYCAFDGVYMPLEIAELMSPEEGILNICTAHGKGLEFTALQSDYKELVYDLEGYGTFDTVFSFTITKTDVKELKRVNGTTYDTPKRLPQSLLICEFNNMTLGNKPEEGLIFKIVRPFQEYAHDEIVRIPNGMDEAIIEMTTKFLIGAPQVDMLNNNSDIKPR